MSDASLTVPPQVLGARLQQARKAAGLTQQELADALDLARTTVVAIEKGERRIHPAELIRIASVVGRQVGDLMRSTEPAPPLALQLRATIPPDTPLAEVLERHAWEFQQLCEDYLELERVCEAPLSRAYPPERRISGPALDETTEDLAVAERQRLGLGDGPIFNLRDLLEREVGLRIFYKPLPPDIAAMFAYADEFGGCILVNRNHPEERRRNSLAHEYAHFLTARRRSEVEFAARYTRTPELERIANVFARTFLMPATGIRRRFNELRQTRNDFTTADLLTMAHYYGVSPMSLTLRLEELRLVRSGTWERVRESGLRLRDAWAHLKLTAPVASDDILPTRYVYLALDAYRRKILSEERLAHFLRLDVLGTRELIAQFGGQFEYGPDESVAAFTLGEPRLRLEREPPAVLKPAPPAGQVKRRGTSRSTRGPDRTEDA